MHPRVSQALVAVDLRTEEAGLPPYTDVLRALRDVAEFAERFAESNNEPRLGACRSAVAVAQQVIQQADAAMAPATLPVRSEARAELITWEVIDAKGKARRVKFDSDGNPRGHATYAQVATLLALHKAGWRCGSMGQHTVRFIDAKPLRGG